MLNKYIPIRKPLIRKLWRESTVNQTEEKVLMKIKGFTKFLLWEGVNDSPEQNPSFPAVLTGIVVQIASLEAPPVWRRTGSVRLQVLSRKTEKKRRDLLGVKEEADLRRDLLGMKKEEAEKRDLPEFVAGELFSTKNTGGARI